MKGKKSTRSAFLTSLMSLVLCFAMLLGTTFAWFTDTASTAVNKIQAGNLDVKLEMATTWDASGNPTGWENAEGKTLSWRKAAGSAETVLWEPGCTYKLPELRISNGGDLKLKYKVVITGIQGSAKLNEAIVWTINDENLSADHPLDPNRSDILTISGHMKEEAGNEYQGLSIDGISITVYATQVEGEYDSIGNNYDQGLDYNERHATIMGADGKTITLETGKTYTVGTTGSVAVDANGNITYTNSGAAQTVTIQTNGGKLTVNAPNDTVYHYGEADFVDVNAVAGNSFHEFGQVAVLAVTSGRVVIEKGDNVTMTQVKGSEAVVSVPVNVTLDTKLQKAGTNTIKLQKGDKAEDIIAVTVADNGSVSTVGAVPTELKKVIENNTTVDEAGDYVARIGKKFYSTLADAIAAVPDAGAEPSEITMLCDVKNAAGMSVDGGKNFVVDFNGYTYELNKPGAGSSGTETNGFQFLKSSTIVMKNGTITISEENLTPAAAGKNIKRIIQNYSTLTLQDMTIDGTNQYGGADLVMSFNNDPVNIIGNTNIIAAEGKRAFDADGNWGKYNRSEVTIDTTGTIVGNIELGQGELNIKNANVKGGVVLCTSCGTDETTDQKKRLTITGGTFTVSTGTELNTLLDCIGADATNVTINLAKDIELNSVLEIGKSVTINGNGHSIYNTANRVIRITQPNLDVNMYDLGIISKCTASSDVRGISFDEVSSGTSLLLDGCTVSASFYAINIIPGPKNLNITIKNGTVAAGWAAINCYANNSTFTIENSVLRGLNDKGENSWNDFATIVFDGNGLWNANNIGVNGSNNTMNISNSTIYASSDSSNNQAWLAVQYGAQNEKITIDANTKIIDANDVDQSENITIIPFVGYSNKKYAKSYDTHSQLIVDGVTEQICYHGESDNGVLAAGGVHVPYDGCTVAAE